MHTVVYSIEQAREYIIRVGNVLPELVNNLVRVERYDPRWECAQHAFDHNGGYWCLMTCRYYRCMYKLNY